MKNDNLIKKFSGLKTTAAGLEKQVEGSFKKNELTHDVRVFFKKLKAHIVLLHLLGGSKTIDLSDALRTYYLEIGLLRDAKIFRALCKKYTDNNKLIMVLGQERVVQAKQKIKKYKKNIQSNQLAKEIQQLTAHVVHDLQSFEPKRIEAGLETFFEHTENLISQLLQSDTLTHVGFHTIRKHIKKVVYLLDYMCFFDAIKYKSIQKKYTKLAENLGVWNDLQLLVQQLEEFPRTGKEEKLVQKLIKKEADMRKKLLKKLRGYFRVSPTQAIKTTQWVSSPSTPISLPVEESSARKQETTIEEKKVVPVTKKPVTKKPVTKKPVTKKPVTKKPVTKKPVTKKPVTKKPVTKKPVTKKPVTKKPVTKKPNRPGSAQ